MRITNKIIMTNFENKVLLKRVLGLKGKEVAEVGGK
jgi:hypothetical protein